MAYLGFNPQPDSPKDVVPAAIREVVRCSAIERGVSLAAAHIWIGESLGCGYAIKEDA